MKLFSNFTLARLLAGPKVMFLRENCEVIKARVPLCKKLGTLIKDPRVLCSHRRGKDRDAKHDWEDEFHFLNQKSAHNVGINRARANSLQDYAADNYAAEVSAFRIQTNGLLFDLFRITVELRFRSVMTVALSALKTLTSGAVATSFDLSLSGLAIVTFQHAELYIVLILVSSLPLFLMKAAA
jgi:hypothetical protein